MSESPASKSDEPEWEPPRRLYFIQAGGEDGPIKIGIASDPWSRLETLQTGNHEPLALLGCTRMLWHARSTERFFHEFFASTRIRSEWFLATDDLIDAAYDFCADENRSFWRDHEEPN